MTDETISTPEENDKIVFKRSQLYMILVPLAFILGLSAGYLLWGRGSGGSVAQKPAQAANTTAPVVTQQQAVQRYSVPDDGDPSIGPANAPITIIEFSDYECPYCERWHTEVYTRLLEEYGDKIRIVFRDFPLSSIHPNAQPAAEAAHCAGEQNAYWQFHDKIFQGDELGEEIYLQYAKELGLDVESFKTCIQSGRFSNEVAADYQYAAELGVRSTPTFFINGLAVVGAQPYEVFKNVIDQELAGEIP